MARMRNGGAMVLACVAAPAGAQTGGGTSGAAPAAEEQDDVIVAAPRPPGSAIGTAEPIAVLDQQALRSLGATSLTELLRRLKPLTTGSGGGDPVVLVNGRRIGGFAQIQALPYEAIERSEILPEEDAARFGFPPTVRVLNLITKKHFRATVAQQTAGTTTEGGGASQQAELTASRIESERRATLQVSHYRRRPIRQDQRDIAPDLVPLRTDDRSPAFADVASGRYLLPLTDTIKVDGTFAQPIGPKTDASLNLSMEATRNRRRNGLAPLIGDDPALPTDLPTDLPTYLPGSALRQHDSALTLRGNGELHGAAGRWTWDATGGYERVRGAVVSGQAVALVDDAVARALVTRGHSLTGTASAKLTASGPLVRLPAGEVLVTTSADLSRSTSSGDVGVDAPLPPSLPVPALRRTTAGASVSAVLPIAAASEGVLSALGRLNANAMVGVSRVSAFGRLNSLNYGLNWQPAPVIEFSASVNLAQTAPAITSLTGAVVAVPNIPVFDYATGDSVTVAALYGGNPALPPEQRRIATVGVAVRPFPKRQVELRADYLDTRVTDLTVMPVSGTRAFEGAFPGRFLRDADGRLVQLDLRAASVAREDERRLRFTLNLWTELGAPPPAPPLPPPEKPDPAAPPAPPPKPRPSIYIMGNTTFRLSDRLTLLPGQPALDLLDGATLDGNGGRARWEVDGNVGANYGPASIGVYGRLQGPTRVRGDLPAADLRFSGLGSLMLYGFLDAEPIVSRPWARKLSLQFTVDNLFNDRIDVRDRTGATPRRFQRGLIDPSGRSIRMGVRKLF